MNRTLIGALAALSLIAPVLTPVAAQEEPKGAPSPGEIVAGAAVSDWLRIAPENLLVMTLAPDGQGNARQVVIQLMPAPFSQGWVDNIRLFARTGWYDNISVNRVQDNYVVQWGDPNYDNPEATGETKSLPEGLKLMGEDGYTVPLHSDEYVSLRNKMLAAFIRRFPADHQAALIDANGNVAGSQLNQFPQLFAVKDSYSDGGWWSDGWPVSNDESGVSAIHCYGMVGVGRNFSPDTGSGAELYTVIGHAPRHLDRNIALVGRVIEGMEHLSSLPRGKGELGFYAADEVDKRTPILSVRVASDLPSDAQPRFEYLDTDGKSFARYAESRANRRDAFFIHPAGGADICNIPVPVRRVATGD